MFKLNRYAKDLNDKMAEVRLAAQTLDKWANILSMQSQKNMYNMQGQIYSRLDRRLENLENKFEDKFIELCSKIERGNTLEQVAPMVFNSFQLVLKDEWNRKLVRDWTSESDSKYKLRLPQVSTRAEVPANLVPRKSRLRQRQQKMS